MAYLSTVKSSILSLAAALLVSSPVPAFAGVPLYQYSSSSYSSSYYYPSYQYSSRNYGVSSVPSVIQRIRDKNSYSSSYTYSQILSNRRGKSASLLNIFDERDLFCGKPGWTFPILIGGSKPITACILEFPKHNVFGGPMSF